ncbi:MAG TPA: GNAT family protein [Planctomycetota bacterium]|nr:GNAT family protein [Planctomycetota bacterium]
MIRFRRIRLRRPETVDDHVLQVAWRNSPLARESFYSEDEVTMEQHMRWHERVMADPRQRFFMIDALTEPPPRLGRLEEPRPIGTTSLLAIDRDHGRAEYGRLLIGCPEYRGGGFAFEAELALMHYAFHELDLNRVYGEVLTGNEAVRRLHRKVGFQEEGVLRQHVFKRGRHEDVVVVGLLASDFAGLHGNAGLVRDVEVSDV